MTRINTLNVGTCLKWEDKVTDFDYRVPDHDKYILAEGKTKALSLMYDYGYISAREFYQQETTGTFLPGLSNYRTQTAVYPSSYHWRDSRYGYETEDFLSGSSAISTYVKKEQLAKAKHEKIVKELQNKIDTLSGKLDKFNKPVDYEAENQRTYFVSNNTAYYSSSLGYTRICSVCNKNVTYWTATSEGKLCAYCHKKDKNKKLTYCDGSKCRGYYDPSYHSDHCHTSMWITIPAVAPKKTYEQAYWDFVKAGNHFDALKAKDALVELVTESMEPKEDGSWVKDPEPEKKEVAVRVSRPKAVVKYVYHSPPLLFSTTCMMFAMIIWTLTAILGAGWL